MPRAAVKLSILLSFAAACWAAGAVKSLNAFVKLDETKNLARRAFPSGVIRIDASKLGKGEHYSKLSEWLDLKPNTRYTLGVVYRASGPSLVSAGVKWRIKGQPIGLVEQEDYYACWPAASEWTLKTLTFTSDPVYAKTRIILKAYGGMKLEVKAVKLAEGWYVNR